MGAWVNRTHGRAATRLAIVALAGFSSVTGVVLILSIAPSAWATDAHRNLLAARALLDGTFGTVEGYLYSPLAAALTVPALAVPEDAAVFGWLVLRAAILLISTMIASRSLRPWDRLLVSVAAIAFLPVLYDLELGNVTILVAATIALVAWTPDRASAGIPLGIVLATAPKPQLIPVLVWMALFRRRAFGGALGAAGLATLGSLVVVGPGPYQSWIAALRAAPDVPLGNLSLSGLPALLAIAAGCAVIIGTLLALRRGPAPGLVAALACGLLVSPYTILYAAGILLVAVPSLARAAPRTTLALAMVAPAALVVAFPLWVGSVMLLALMVPRRRWPREILTSGAPRDPSPAAAP